MSRLLPVMLPTRLLRVVVVALATVAVACGDPTRPKATVPNFSLSYSVYSLTGSSAALPNALDFFSGPTRADASFDFDLALDLDATGKILVYPVNALAGPIVGTIPTRVGLQVMSGTFESVLAAPERGYDIATVQTIAPGTVVAVEVVDQLTGVCLYSLNGSSRYAKFVVDSVNAATRRFYVRTVADANCGYRSLVPNEIPTI